ncbi:MAG: hypothetical protein ABIK68_18890 [bacterium]
MAYSTIRFEEKESIGILTLNRPNVINAMNQNLGVTSLEQALHLENRNQSFMIAGLKISQS